MQQYRFHINDGTGFPDPDPVEFESIDVAKREAVRFAGELLLDHVEHLEETGRIDLHVTDAAGDEIIKVSITADGEAARLRDADGGRGLRLAAVGRY